MKPNSRIPMLLSAFACPGAGQFMQNRWRAGLFYGSGFLVGFCWFLMIALHIIFSFYRLAFELDYQPEDPNIIGMIPPLLISTVFYLANLFDVFIAQQRICRNETSQDTAR